MRRVISIAMTVEADTAADLADLYRRGLAQIALTLASGKSQGTLHAGNAECHHPHTLRGVFTVEAQHHLPPTTSQEHQR